VTVPGAPDASPSGDNVNHGYYQQVRTFEARLEENADDTTAMRSLGRLLQDAHQDEDAVRWYTRYLELNPASSEVRVDLGSALAASGDLTGAEGAMEALLEQHPDDPRALYNLGAIAANRGDAETARSIWNRALKLKLEPDLEETVASALSRLDGHSSR
jgi:Flp pilus assembly protein TadD